ncbi:MAG: alpha/beta fold hydrolase [Betaproteobacteria bacterium]|nr:alpha/beta fold hydrolase [Betaproteobacteria bacterium]
MPTITSPDSILHFAVHDLVAPWVSSPQTILFHHGLGATSETWAGWFPALADRYRIVTFDMRGHGRSDHPPADAPLTLELLAQDLFRVADAADVGQFHLVGESIGGTIALLAALDRPDRVRSLTVSNGAHLGGSIQNLDDWKETMDRGGMAAWSRHMMGRRFYEDAIDPAMWAWYEREQAGASPEFVLRAVKLLVGADLSSRLPALTQRALLLHGDSSPFIPVKIMADLHAKLPNARLQIFPHARHGLPFSHAADCSRALRRFLDEGTLSTT